MSHIGDLIKKKRIEKGLTQFRLAAKLACFSSMFLSNVESGKVGLPLKHLVAICGALGIKKEEAARALMNDYNLKIMRML